MSEKIVIATRESPLALWQAEHVKSRLETAHPDIEVSLLGMTSRGDQLLDKPLFKVGGKGLFVKELETALLDKRADIAVHSILTIRPTEEPRRCRRGAGAAAGVGRRTARTGEAEEFFIASGGRVWSRG